MELNYAKLVEQAIEATSVSVKTLKKTKKALISYNSAINRLAFNDLAYKELNLQQRELLIDYNNDSQSFILILYKEGVSNKAFKYFKNRIDEDGSNKNKAKSIKVNLEHIYALRTQQVNEDLSGNYSISLLPLDPNSPDITIVKLTFDSELKDSQKGRTVTKANVINVSEPKQVLTKPVAEIDDIFDNFSPVETKTSDDESVDFEANDEKIEESSESTDLFEDLFENN